LILRTSLRFTLGLFCKEGNDFWFHSETEVERMPNAGFPKAPNVYLEVRRQLKAKFLNVFKFFLFLVSTVFSSARNHRKQYEFFLFFFSSKFEEQLEVGKGNYIIFWQIVDFLI
jgi:hypothetical protein